MLDAAPDLTPRELGVAEITLDRARRIAPTIGPDALHWLATVLRRHKSFSDEGRVAALLAALRPVHAVVYLGQIAKPLHLSAREARDTIRALETGGFLKTAPTIRTEALEITLIAGKVPPAPQSGPLAVNLPNQPPQLQKARRRPVAR